MAIIESAGSVVPGYGLFRTAGAPVNGTSGSFANQALPGAQLVREDTGVHYANTNTQASPTWTVIGTQT